MDWLPLQSTTQLVQFLKTNNVTTTHFMIGSNILSFPSQFLEAFNAGGDIAVHTWSHPPMTTLSNAAIVGEVGTPIDWLQLNLTSLTRWRFLSYRLVGRCSWSITPLVGVYPDTGDRPTEIPIWEFALLPKKSLDSKLWSGTQSKLAGQRLTSTKLTHIFTSTFDYQLGDQQQIVDKLAKFLARPKSPGLITLEHEIKDVEVSGFINAFPLIASHGWKFRSLAEIIGGGQAYQNVNGSTSDVSNKGILATSALTPATSPTLSTATIPSTSSSTSSPSQLASSSQRPSSARPASVRSVTACSVLFFSIVLSYIFL